MSLWAFRKAGNLPTLLSAFLYFDVSFMVWVILGPLGPFIGEAYHLSATQKGLLTAVPLLGGSCDRNLKSVSAVYASLAGGKEDPASKPGLASRLNTIWPHEYVMNLMPDLSTSGYTPTYRTTARFRLCPKWRQA